MKADFTTPNYKLFITHEHELNILKVPITIDVETYLQQRHRKNHRFLREMLHIIHRYD